MGKDSTLKKQRRGEVIHLRKLFGGKTAEEVHRSIALRGRKCQCGIQASFRVVSFAPVDELVKRAPLLLVQLARENGGQVPIVHTKHGKHVKVGETFGCDICKVAVQRVAAKAPSWVIVDFDWGPTPTKAHGQVPGGDAA